MFSSTVINTLSDIYIYFFEQTIILISLSQFPDQVVFLLQVQQKAKRIANDFSSQVFFNGLQIKFGGWFCILLGK